ncbi:hypothetical protein Pla110_37130 [Polystyrenella longa]|uniref:Uncharacterized protein n=1 Tax=Polystyrenella longa TaxID=2528007 RepID=A0A518CRV5_9PLAN|nr:hypothetical protein Pla110_37130 [Polystyrenella longa]
MKERGELTTSSFAASFTNRMAAGTDRLQLDINQFPATNGTTAPTSLGSRRCVFRMKGDITIDRHGTHSLSRLRNKQRGTVSFDTEISREVQLEPLLFS